MGLIYRCKRDNWRPDPTYSNNCNKLTLNIHHSGNLVHDPVSSYEGGAMLKFDHVSPSEMTIKNLVNVCGHLGVTDITRFFHFKEDRFKLVNDDDELLRVFMWGLSGRNMHLYCDLVLKNNGNAVESEGSKRKSTQIDSSSFDRFMSEDDSEFEQFPSDCESGSSGGAGLEDFNDSDCDFNSECSSDDEDFVFVEDKKLLKEDDVDYDEFIDCDVEDELPPPLSGDESDEVVEEEKEYDSGSGDSDQNSPGEADVIESGDEFGSAAESGEEDEATECNVFNRNDMYDPKFTWKMKFSSKKELRKAIHAYHVKHRRNVIIPTNDKKRLYAKCKSKRCKWIIRARKVDGEQTWQIGECNTVHTCNKESRVKSLKASYVAERYIDRFKSDSNRDIQGFAIDVAKETKCSFSRKQGYTAK